MSLPEKDMTNVIWTQAKPARILGATEDAGDWLFSDMTAGPSSPLSYSTYYFPIPNDWHRDVLGRLGPMI